MAVNVINVKWQQLFGKIEGLRTDTQNRISVDREIIPIIFVPGIMGSRLRRRKDKEKIWDPDARLFMVRKYGWITVSAAERKALVIGSEFRADYAEVCDCDKGHNKKFASDLDPTREKRGWGGVMWESYGRFLISLQEHQWPSPLNACFEFPVHAFGYNWTASNMDSGLALKNYIEKTTADYRTGALSPDGRARACRKVILVTHSMGGLVARSACVLHGAKDVIGVIHGVQPAVGSPAAYWRMKAGFERPRGGPKKDFWDWWRNPLKMAMHHLFGRITAFVLGTDGEEVTSLLGNSPGGLELLPTAEYRDNHGKREWLRYPTECGFIELPVADPFEEIYPLENVAYRMVDPTWLDPKNNVQQADSDRASSGGPWDKYTDHLKEAKRFHSLLGTKCHPETYQFYGTDLDSPDRIEFTRQEVKDGSLIHRGGFRIYVDKGDRQVNDEDEAVAIVTLELSGGKGDGTVPESSASSLPLLKARTAKIGTAEGSWFEIGHQDILGTVRAQEIVFTCIRNLGHWYIDDNLGLHCRKPREA